METRTLVLLGLLAIVLVTIYLQIFNFGKDISWFFLLILIGAYYLTRRFSHHK